jgi:hypothetical protein
MRVGFRSVLARFLAGFTAVTQFTHTVRSQDSQKVF